MTLVRTTLRVKSNLKKAAEKHAVQENTTLQEIFNIALEEYLTGKAKQKAKKLMFKSYDLGEPLDNLTRDDFYDTP
jgi:hypothetical protein